MFAVAAFGLWLTFSQPQPSAPRSGGQANPSAASPLRPLYHDLALASGLAEAHIGPVAALALDLPEMGVSGTAIVVSLDPAPPIPGGAGSVVTGTFAHPPEGEGSCFKPGEGDGDGFTPLAPMARRGQRVAIMDR